MAEGFFPANGVWAVVGLNHYLDSKVVGGEWKSVAYCIDAAYAKSRAVAVPHIIPSPG
ncbi:MAG TPA: hypothetical protein VG328_07330 [Stellaceae bacterium]|nr:hypothetical protein [Stellaceae bacterium]